jgi:hypothetical protein
VALQLVLAEDEGEQFTPAGVERRCDVEDEQHDGADVLDSHRLSMQIEEGCSLVLKKDVAVRGFRGDGEVIAVAACAAVAAVAISYHGRASRIALGCYDPGLRERGPQPHRAPWPHLRPSVRC